MRQYLKFDEKYGFNNYLVFTDSIEALEEHFKLDTTKSGKRTEQTYLSIYLKSGTELEVNGNINQVIYGMEQAEKRKNGL